jgi:O-antigen/teichoic acid export membrane protein
MSLLFYFGSDRLGEFYFHHEKASQVVRIFSIYFLFFNAFQIITWVASAFQKTLLEKGAHFIQVFVTSLSAVIVFLLFPNSIIHYAWIRVIGLIAAVVVGSIWYYKLFKQFISFPTLNFNIEKSERKEIFNYAGILFLTINVSMLLGQADLQMVTYMMWPKYAWYFANYRVLLVISNALIIPLSTFLFPLVSELYAKKDTQKVKALITVMYKYIPISVMALWFFFIWLWPEIAATLFWVQFTYSWFLLQIAGGFIFLQSLTTINFAVLAWIWKVKSRLWIIITALVFNVIWNYLGIRYFGLPWALCATIFSRTLITILSSYELNKVVKIDWPIKMYVRNFSLFIILASLILLFKESIFSIETNTYRYFNFLLLWVSFLLYGLFIVWFNRNLILKIKDQALQIIRQ